MVQNEANNDQTPPWCYCVINKNKMLNARMHMVKLHHIMHTN